VKTSGRIIRNFDELIANAADAAHSKIRRTTLELLEEAIQASDPRKAIKKNLRLSNDRGTIGVGGTRFKLKKQGNVYVIGAGKASGAMSEEVEKLLGDKISEGCVSILRGTRSLFKTRIVELRESSHPIPGSDSMEAAKRILTIVDRATPNDTILCLLSGGGSSLFSLPPSTVELEDFQKVIQLLLKRGATINDLNVVRKHISQVSGGGLAKLVAPKGCEMIVLVLSDVVGDPIDVVAGGPTAPDTSTFKEAVEVLNRYGIWDATPDDVKQHLLRGLNGTVPETPKDGSNMFTHVHNFIIGSCRQACYAANRKAKELRIHSMVLSTMVQGEAREVGKITGSIGKELSKYDSPIRKPTAIIMGGETTVTVRGDGIGGRNQELALSASESIDRVPKVAVASLGTDGVDGPTDAAGALVDGLTVTKARTANLSTNEYLFNNDSNTFFKKLGDGLIITGPTGTNVNDIMIVIAT
jgi:glycerate-2-kinase